MNEKYPISKKETAKIGQSSGECHIYIERERIMDRLYTDICQAYGTATVLICGFSYFIVSIAQ